MTRETALRDIGIELNTDAAFVSTIAIGAIKADPKFFSGYGSYTPVTVSSETVKRDAFLERNQSRS
jgi:hypothetical protein